MCKANKALMFFLCMIINFSVNAQLSDVSKNIDAKKFDPAVLLWYDQPAAKWEDAMPVGNGRLGAMVFGKTDEERIQFNEDTYWTGGPYSTGWGSTWNAFAQRL